MSKGLSQIDNTKEKFDTIARRLDMPEAMRGLGYWGAVDAEVAVERQRKAKRDGKREDIRGA